MFFKDGRFQWAWDNSYHLLMHPPEVFDELLDAFKTIHQIKPDKPLSTVRLPLLSGTGWKKSPVTFDRDLFPFNTADESIVFAYEEGNRSGVHNGFFFGPQELDSIPEGSLATLVLPPLSHATEEQRQKIRQLHQKGVSLVCFESVPGLEDVFGIVPAPEPREVHSLRPTATPLSTELFADVSEETVRHSGSQRQLSYTLAAGAVSLLDCLDAEGRVLGPALVYKKGEKADALFWTIPPTDIARSACHAGMRNRGECQSELVRAAMGKGLRLTAHTPATTSAGKLNAFWDKQGRLVIMVCEDAHPYPSRTIHPLVRLALPGAAAWSVASDKAHTIAQGGKDELLLRLDLERNEYATFIITPAPKRPAAKGE